MAEGDLNLFQVAQFLQDELHAFLAGAAEAPGMRNILEFAAQHIPVAENDGKGKHHVGAKRRRGVIAGDEQTICEHSCSEHKEVMSPALWGALPKELLHIVFARLPLAEIIRLKSLSKEWKTSIETAHSDFNQVCEATNSKNRFALVTTDSQQHGVFWVRVLDMKANRWHEFELISGDTYCVEIVACDGGLVCLLSVAPDYGSDDGSGFEDSPKRLLFTIWNPLTREKNKLPAIRHLDGLYPTMVQLSVDPQTKHYKVMVANDKVLDSGTEETAYIYDSQSRQRSKMENSSRVIFGMSYYWPSTDIYSCETVVTRPCKFDFAKARLHKLKRKVEPWGRMNVASFAVMEDRMFVLRESMDDPVFCIAEYHADVSPGSAESGSNWLFRRTHSCGPLESLLVTEHEILYFLNLFACKQGFLLVCAQNKEAEDSPFYYQRLWLYDLSTGKWRDLPNLVKYREISGDPDDDVSHLSNMCELWPWHSLR